MLALAPGVGGKSHLVGAPPFSPRFKDSSNTEHQKSNPDPSIWSTISVLGPLASLYVLCFIPSSEPPVLMPNLQTKKPRLEAGHTAPGGKAGISTRSVSSALNVSGEPQTGVCGHVRSRRMFQKCNCWGHDNSGQRCSFLAAAIF